MMKKRNRCFLTSKNSHSWCSTIQENEEHIVVKNLREARNSISIYKLKPNSKDSWKDICRDVLHESSQIYVFSTLEVWGTQTKWWSAGCIHAATLHWSRSRWDHAVHQLQTLRHAAKATAAMHSSWLQVEFLNPVVYALWFWLCSLDIVAIYIPMCHQITNPKHMFLVCKCIYAAPDVILYFFRVDIMLTSCCHSEKKSNGVGERPGRFENQEYIGTGIV